MRYKNKGSVRVTSQNSELFKPGDGTSESSTLLVTFGGCALKAGGILPFEFLGIVSKNFPDLDTYFYIDKNMCWYHQGILGLTEDIQSTVAELSDRISSYDRVVFMGGSAGGYAAILFGSLLNVDYVVAFNPQTDLHHVKKHIPSKYDWEKTTSDYMDILPYFNDTTKYSIYTQDKTIKSDIIHHRHHSDRVRELSKDNVYVVKVDVGMKGLRDSGDLYKIISKHVYGEGEVNACIQEEESDGTVCTCA